MKKWLRLVVLSFLICGVWLSSGIPVSLAHGNVSVAYSDITLEHNTIKYVLQLDMYDMMAEVNPDDPDLALTTAEVLNKFFSNHQAEVKHLLLTKIQLYADGLPLEGKLTQFRYIEKENEMQPFAEAVIEYPVKRNPQQFTLDYNLVFDRDQWHVNYVNLTLGELKKEAVLIAQITKLQVGELKLPGILQHFPLLGVEQSFRSYESILVLAILILGFQSTKPALRTLAIFAATQSLTLLLSGLHVIALPDRLLNALIPLSVVFLALSIYYNRTMKELPWIAGGLGIIHGFRYASPLVGLREDVGHFALSVTAFYAGLEASVLLITLSLLISINYFRKVKYSTAFILGAAALVGLFSFTIKVFF
ncbi:HupE/UreJ family protein [Paenibacillus agri]|uniref:HupE/UreJ family protein n=1 Tax=Paenibacillus agri TaxID=2744309 RepID=A0A850EJ52_9BACL|nr:HupE/UreJ family protein [Paenibacillus agri]NUU59457.1 HupE/UreJ family protein [Paenibacillus agri]